MRDAFASSWDPATSSHSEPTTNGAKSPQRATTDSSGLRQQSLRGCCGCAFPMSSSDPSRVLLATGCGTAQTAVVAETHMAALCVCVLCKRRRRGKRPTWHLRRRLCRVRIAILYHQHVHRLVRCGVISYRGCTILWDKHPSLDAKNDSMTLSSSCGCIIARSRDCGHKVVCNTYVQGKRRKQTEGNMTKTGTGSRKKNKGRQHENGGCTIYTHFTHARRPVPTLLLCFHARCYSSLLENCTCRKTLHRARCQRRWVGPPGTRCRSQPPRSTEPRPPSQRESERSREAEGTCTTGMPPSHEGDHTPPILSFSLRVLHVPQPCVRSGG